MSWTDDDLLPEPADPWADDVTTAFHPVDPTAPFAAVDPTLFDTEPAPQTMAAARRSMTHPLFGAIYCGQTATDPDKYVGKSGPRTARDGRRVQCSPGRRVDEHRTDKPWGGELLPGRAGYRVLEWVEESGHGRAYDEANLRYREALWIQRINPTENSVRPVPVPPEEALQRVAVRTQREAARPSGGAARTKPVAWLRTVAFLFWTVLYTAGAAWLLALGVVPWLPWVGAPAIGVVLGWTTLWEIRRKYDRLTNPKARPPAKPRRRTRRRRRSSW